MSVNALVLRNVVGLFDGMSGLQIALKDMNIHFDTYYASEVDKHAIKQTQHVFPSTIQLGDITKWREWNIDWSMVDLIGAGSPCQGFSFAGKQLAFDDPRSKLFFVFIDILNHARKFNQNVLFLLENVSMKKEHMKVINDYCGVFPVNINSNLVSAQNRNRWYWTNIKTKNVGLFGELYSDIPQPKDRRILLKDILETEVDEKYYLSDRMVSFLTNHSDKKQAEGCGFKFKPKDGDKKASTVTQRSYKMGVDDNYVCVSMVGRKTDDNGTRKDNDPNIKAVQSLELNLNGKTNCLTSVQKDNLVMQINPSLESGGKQPYQQNRVYDSEGISPALCANKAGLIVKLNDRQQKNFVAHDEKTNSLLSTSYKGSQANGMSITNSGYRIRRLTPTECARLQTIPDWYTWIVSDTQQYKMLGNGWTNEVIKHILSFIH